MSQQLSSGTLKNIFVYSQYDVTFYVQLNKFLIIILVKFVTYLVLLFYLTWIDPKVHYLNGFLKNMQKNI